ncbi:hypothetical protein BCR42DRAFT_403663 [Absidia repens]|uniref:Uncharacterized protein n=1 Tax=Absidia repens TaxID=90262 RepID=A0A1X2IVA3_9FUNG|nr:hypothetical protein BCR42DRAFT_403663 [Absidia repens]
MPFFSYVLFILNCNLRLLSPSILAFRGFGLIFFIPPYSSMYISLNHSLDSHHPSYVFFFILFVNIDHSPLLILQFFFNHLSSLQHLLYT